MRPPWMRRAPADLRSAETCIACREPSTAGRICRGCRFELRVAIPLVRAAIYGDLAPARTLAERIARFERGDFTR